MQVTTFYSVQSIALGYLRVRLLDIYTFRGIEVFRPQESFRQNGKVAKFVEEKSHDDTALHSCKEHYYRTIAFQKNTCKFAGWMVPVTMWNYTKMMWSLTPQSLAQTWPRLCGCVYQASARAGRNLCCFQGVSRKSEILYLVPIQKWIFKSCALT